MEVRKIIGFGKSSFVISLPKDWMNANKLEKGDLVFLEQEGDHLEVLPKEKEQVREEKTLRISVSGKTLKKIKREIFAAYLNYTDYIILEGTEVRRYAKEITKEIHNLIALEVMEQTAEKIVARDFLSVKEVNVAENLKKEDVALRSIFIDLKDPECKDYEELLEREEQVDRIYFLILKVCKAVFWNVTLLKGLKCTLPELLSYYQLNSDLRLISKLTKSTVRLMITMDKTDRKKIAEQVEKVYDYYIEVMKVLNAESKEKAFQLAPRRDVLVKELKDELKTDERLVVVREQLISVCRVIHMVLRRIYVWD